MNNKRYYFVALSLWALWIAAESVFTLTHPGISWVWLALGGAVFGWFVPHPVAKHLAMK